MKPFLRPRRLVGLAINVGGLAASLSQGLALLH